MARIIYQERDTLSKKKLLSNFVSRQVVIVVFDSFLFSTV